MLFAVTSNRSWWTRRPLIAANMPRIIGGSSFVGFPASSRRSGRGGRGWSWSGDHGAVDVREHLLAHVSLVDRGDHGSVRDGDDEGRSVDEDERVAPALRRRARDPVLEPRELARAEIDAAALDPVEGVPAETKRRSRAGGCQLRRQNVLEPAGSRSRRGSGGRRRRGSRSRGLGGPD